jgi:hypothetical protein
LVVLLALVVVICYKLRPKEEPDPYDQEENPRSATEVIYSGKETKAADAYRAQFEKPLLASLVIEQGED